MSKKYFYLSIIDHRNMEVDAHGKQFGKHLYRNEKMTFSELTDKLDDFFIDWDEAFEQNNKGVAIGQMYHNDALDYEHFALESIGTEEVLYSEIDSKLECFEKRVMHDLDMFVIKHKVKLTQRSSNKKSFEVYIGSSTQNN